MKLSTVVLLLVSGSSVAIAGGDPVAGKATSILCIGCHGVDGNSDNSIYPKLAGQGEGYLTKQLADFKTGARKDEHMSSMVEAVDVSDIPHIAAFFAGQRRTASPAEMPATELGRQIYHAGIRDKGITACASCHGPNGSGQATANIPALAGQHAEYVAKALKHFRSGARSNDPQKMMGNVAAELSDQEIEAVSSYSAGLH
jgi:cytochrome c553